MFVYLGKKKTSDAIKGFSSILRHFTKLHCNNNNSTTGALCKHASCNVTYYGRLGLNLFKLLVKNPNVPVSAKIDLSNVPNTFEFMAATCLDCTLMC